MVSQNPEGPEEGTRKLVLVPGGLAEIQKPSLLEQKASEPTKKSWHLNLLPSYGILQKPMESFRSAKATADVTENYLFLKSALYGLHNMESLGGNYGIPHEMLTQGHPAVDLTLYYIAHVLKRIDVLPPEALQGGNEKFRRRAEKLKELQRIRKLGDIGNVGEFVDKAFGYALENVHGLRVFYNAHYKHLHSRQFRDRFNSVSEESRRLFMHNLMSGIISIDPIISPDPENKMDIHGINSYTARIIKSMETLYSRNTRACEIRT